MSLLSIAVHFAKRTNINVPTTVLGTTDPQIKQLLGLLEEEGNDLASRGDWQELTNEATHTTVGVSGTTTFVIPQYLSDNTASFDTDDLTIGDPVINDTTSASTTLVSISSTALELNDDIFTTVGDSYSIKKEKQGKIASIASNGFKYIKNDTIWDRDLRLPVYVIDATDWQQVKAIDVTGPRYQARLRGGDLISNPSPIIGHTWAFEYITKNWIQDSSGANDSQYFNNDTDVPILPEELLLLGLRWRWAKEKGFEYAEAFRTYELEVHNALSRNQMRRPLNMSEKPYIAEPRVYVPNGSWGL